MFKVEDNFIFWDDSKYRIPDECTHKNIINIYGTATSGLARQPGIFIKVRAGDSVEVATATVKISARLVGDLPVRGAVVCLREQLEPITGKAFWLASLQEIKNDVNWINVEFEDGSVLCLCPFTMDYGIK